MRRFFIDKNQLSAPQTVITGPDAHHIRVVLRLKPGDAIEVIDGDGGAYRARISALQAGQVALRDIQVLGRVSNEPPVKVTIAQGMLKDRKMDGLIRQLTELGIFCWIPFYAGRSVPRPDARRLAARTARWRKISVEALKQCRRNCLPHLLDPVGFADMLTLSDNADLKVAFWEDEPALLERSLPAADPRKCRNIFVVIGPEGGLTGDEVVSARAAGFVTASLGPRILRAETATLAAAVMMQIKFGDMGKFA